MGKDLRVGWAFDLAAFGKGLRVSLQRYERACAMETLTLGGVS